MIFNYYKKIPENPENDKLVEVLCSDFRGEYWTKAQRKNYKPGAKTAKNWRFIDVSGNILSGKEEPTEWREVE
jgi:hypothetical protein